MGHGVFDPGGYAIRAVDYGTFLWEEPKNLTNRFGVGRCLFMGNLGFECSGWAVGNETS